MTITVYDKNVNPDDYVYETNLKFCDDVGQEILKIANDNESFFERRIKYNDGNTKNSLFALARNIGIENAREIIRRKEQIAQMFPNQSFINFKQYWLGQEFNKKILDETPDFIKQIVPNEPFPILQISDTESDGLLPPHCGHKRISSLFMLLQGSGQETRWYFEKESFKIIDKLHIPDLDKIDLACSVVMKPNVWYVFNHKAWHSVHKFPTNGEKRISIGVDFNNVSASELVQIIKRNTVCDIG